MRTDEILKKQIIKEVEDELNKFIELRTGQKVTEQTEVAMRVKVIERLYQEAKKTGQATGITVEDRY